MSDWFHVGAAENFIEGKGRAVDAGTERVAVFRVNGQLHAMQDHCPHMLASLADGRIDQARRVICHMHGWTFDLVTGKPEGGISKCARVFEIENREGQVYVRVPAPPAAESKPATDDDDDWIPWSDDFLKKKPRP